MVSGETTIMEHMKPMGLLKMDRNVAENWKKWKQRWNLYAKASGANEKDEEIQCAIFLHTIGEEALEVYDTFTFTETEQDKIELLIQNFESYCTPRKTRHTNDIYLTHAYKTEENSMHLYLTFATKQRPVSLNHYKTA
jgi:HD superfamily phosphohydrolase YqeK